MRGKAAVLEVKCTTDQMQYIEAVIDEEAARAHSTCRESAWRYELNDLKQTAWEGIAAAWERVETSDNPKAYIRTIARNAMKRYCRRLRADALGGAVQLGEVREDI